MKLIVYGLLLICARATSATIILDCTYSMLIWKVVGTVYTCQARLLYLEDGHNVIGVTQNHLSGKSNADVATLHVIDQAVDRIPTNIGVFFENLQMIFIASTTLKSISKKDFQPFPKLRRLSLYNTIIEKVYGDTLMYLPLLERFDLQDSTLTNVGPGLLQHTAVLTSVSFSGNLCVSSSATNATEVAALSRELAFKCPPTVEMIEEIILEGENFQEAVDEQVEPELTVLDIQIKTLEEKNERAERRIEDLEKFIFNLCSAHAICNF